MKNILSLVRFFKVLFLEQFSLVWTSSRFDNYVASKITIIGEGTSFYSQFGECEECEEEAGFTL